MRWGFMRATWKTTHLKTSCVVEKACSPTAKTPQPRTNRSSDRHLLILKIFCYKSFPTIHISRRYQVHVHCVQLILVLVRMLCFHYTALCQFFTFPQHYVYFYYHYMLNLASFEYMYLGYLLVRTSASCFNMHFYFEEPIFISL